MAVCVCTGLLSLSRTLSSLVGCVSLPVALLLACGLGSLSCSVLQVHLQALGGWGYHPQCQSPAVCALPQHLGGAWNGPVVQASSLFEAPAFSFSSGLVSLSPGGWREL